MAAQTLGKALGIMGITPSVVEVFFVDHEEKVMKAKFADHLASQGISYDTDEEYNYRFSIYNDHDKEIEAINAEQDDYKVAHNKFSTWTKDEMDAVKGHVPHHHDAEPKQLKSAYPESIDWVTQGMVSDIQNQGQCGSCWAFASTATIESAYAIAGNPLTKLSEQQFVNCDTNCGGCHGGNFPPAFTYAKSTKILKESDLPYTGKEATCSKSTTDMAASSGVVMLSGFQTVAANVDGMKSALQVGPVGIAVDASSSSFQYYTSGVVTSSKCGTSIDHAVVAVGYGEHKGKPYVLVRNSWGTSWGQKGYIMISLTSDNICGMFTQSLFYPTVDSSLSMCFGETCFNDYTSGR